METWEYEFVQLAYHSRTPIPPLGWVLEAIGEDGQPGGGYLNLRSRVAELGQQGWELAGVVAAGDANVNLLIFKRRKR